MADKKRVFLDMDGVLCEYRENASVEDMHADGYFRSLRPRQPMLDAVKRLIETGETEVFILSAVFPERKNEATAEKNEWLNEYLPMINSDHRIFPLCGTDKAGAVSGISRSDVLLDDYSKNLFSWALAGGSAVKILNEVNGKLGTFMAGPRLRVTSRDDLVNTIRAI